MAVAVAVAFLFAALYPLQFVLDALRARNLLRGMIAGLFLSGAALVAFGLARRRASLRAWLVLLLAGATYAGLALAMAVPQERLHLVEYGALALLLRAAFSARFTDGAPGGNGRGVNTWTLATATAIGWLDEAIQGMLPNRQYDLRDVGFNALAAALALGVAAAIRAAMRPVSGATAVSAGAGEEHTGR